MRLSIIVALDEHGVIGRDNDLPWHLPADLRRFKQLTLGHHLLMGRKTFESIGRALPGRRMVVISRGAPDLPAGVELARSLGDAIALAEAAGDDEAFVGGGAQIYQAALPLAERLYLTRLHESFVGESRFPEFDTADWNVVFAEAHDPDERNRYGYSFQILDRV